MQRQDNPNIRMESLDVSSAWIDEDCVEEVARLMVKLMENEPDAIFSPFATSEPGSWSDALNAYSQIRV